ncbi:hypothetical protein MYAER_3479 [Microcystis aeruginosa NIES-2549]|uniref:Uncharacterized protein n=1 Tax=Microcystis aeruginosa NIES-2549 TaxID=1641812 RepID=A0A0F6U6T2_MICAE|nr:hypothetical protein MYAER_3479 [Microcystis aeruginosa NIES-2549]
MEVKLPSYGLFLSYQSGDILKAKVSFFFACIAEYAFSGVWGVGCGVWGVGCRV